ncbi:terminase large subunit [Bacteriophage sp.]|nr:terminase large subunit [Bacteriophage sp.]UOF80092.1 terminase large subunit [Bacteriophage sp.]
MNREQRRGWKAVQKIRSFNIWRSLIRHHKDRLLEAWAVVDPGKKVPTTAKWAVSTLIRVRPEWALGRLKALGLTKVTDSPVKLGTVKCRQMGWSTLIKALELIFGLFHPNSTSLTVSLDKDSAKNVFEMYTFMLDQWPEEYEDVKPVSDHRARDYFRAENGFTIWIKTSEGAEIRSFKPDFRHLTEAAFYKDQSAVSGSSAGLHWHTWTFYESSANGNSGAFYDLCHSALDIDEAIDRYDAKQPVPDNATYLFFSPWWSHDEYETFVEPWEEAVLQRTLTPYEQSLFAAFPEEMNLRKIKWRREKIASDCQNKPGFTPEQFFMQEFPAWLHEAFQSTGDRVFDFAAIQRQRDRHAATRPTYFLIKREDQLPIAIPYEMRHMANLAVNEPPLPGENYLIATDTAEGLGGKRDASVAAVAKRGDGTALTLVAELADNTVSGVTLGHLAVVLAEWYNNAYIIPEIDKGEGTAAAIVNVCHYYNIHLTQQVNTGVNTPPSNFRYGFKSSGPSKRLTIDELKEALVFDLFDIFSLDGLNELDVFRYAETASRQLAANAPYGKHDDRVTCYRLLWYASRPGRGAPSLLRRPNPKNSSHVASGVPMAVEGDGRDVGERHLAAQVAVAEKRWLEAAARRAGGGKVDKRNPYAYN